MSIRLSLMVATALSSFIPFASAQVASPDADVAGPEADIVVTGSLIRGSREDAAAPVDVIGQDELLNRGSPTAIELLKNLPVSNGVLGDANQFDSRSQGSEGVATANLRGLGAQRTLVLLNGKRIVPLGFGAAAVDINLLPSGAVGRVEVLKDGAAATYGSDAVGGVINFITRTDQRGFLASADYRYIPGSKGDYGGALSYGYSGDGFRFLASVGYQHRSELRTADRDFTIKSFAENPQGGYTSGGNPGNFDFNATVGGINFTADQGCTALGGFRSLPGSTTDRCNTGINGFYNLVEPEDRYQIYVDTEVDLSDRLTLRVDALYGRTTTQITTSPSFLPTQPPSANAAFGGAGLFQIPTYAPALRDYCALYGASAGCATAADGTPLAPAIAFPVLFRPAGNGGNPLTLVDGGRGATVDKRLSESIRFSGNLTWEVADRLDLDAGVTYSEYRRVNNGTDTFGDLLQNALAGFGGTDCAYASAASRVGLSAAQLAALAGTNGCSFFNPFSTAVPANAVTGQANAIYAGTRAPAGYDLTPGAGLVNALDTYESFFRKIRTVFETRLLVGDLALSGTTGIALPGGDVAFALGTQYRKNFFDVTYNADGNLAATPCPGSPLNPAAACSPATGAFGFLGSGLDRRQSGEVWALFGELQLPVTDRINMQLSARYEDYGGQTGSTFNPQARVRVELFDGVTLRAGGGTTFRGPPPQQVAGNVTLLQIIGANFRAVDVMGNAALSPEKATTFGGGIIVDRGPFNVSVDYFRYDLDGPIDAEPVAGIANALFGASGAANCGNPAYAALQARFTFTAAGCGIGNIQRLTTHYVNSADVRTSGLDFQARLRFPVGAVDAAFGVSGTYVIDYKTKDLLVEGVLVQPAFNAVGKLNFQTSAYPLPRWKGLAFIEGSMGIHNARLQLNHIGGYVDQRSTLFGPETANLAGAAVPAGEHVGAFTTLDFIYRATLSGGTSLSFSVLNLLDTDPPFSRQSLNYDPFTANPLGLNAKVTLSQKF